MIRATCSISSILCRLFTFLKLLTFSSLTICYYQLSRHTDVMFHIFAVLVSYSNKWLEVTYGLVYKLSEQIG
jgi:hypothetical protein